MPLPRLVQNLLCNRPRPLPSTDRYHRRAHMETEFGFPAIAARGTEKSNVCASAPPVLAISSTGGSVVQLSTPRGRQFPRFGEQGCPFSFRCRDETVNDEFSVGVVCEKIEVQGAGGTELYRGISNAAFSCTFRAYSYQLLPVRESPLPPSPRAPPQ